MDWQHVLLDRLRSVLSPDAVEPYGSVTDGAGVDGWSDLDVRVRTRGPIDVEDLVDAPLWAWQESRSEAVQQLRLVTADGRRVDLTIDGPPAVLPDPPADDGVRFDAALAATRLGRGNLLIGLHLVMGIGREALVESMRTADLATGTVHHRLPTAYDVRAAEVAALASGPLVPELALRAHELYGRWRAEREPGFALDTTGLVALLERGRAGAVAPTR
jgi:hypothetical protein